MPDYACEESRSMSSVPRILAPSFRKCDIFDSREVVRCSMHAMQTRRSDVGSCISLRCGRPEPMSTITNDGRKGGTHTVSVYVYLQKLFSLFLSQYIVIFSRACLYNLTCCHYSGLFIVSLKYYSLTYLFTYLADIAEDRLCGDGSQENHADRGCCCCL